MINQIKKRVPWWAKIGAKLVLSRIPFGYEIWQKVGLFRHGQMDSANYARNVFASHIQRAGLDGRLAGKTVLELGPGDSIATAVIASAYGARAILADSGRFARQDLAPYLTLADALRADGLSPPDFSRAATLEDILEACRAVYLTDGLRSMRAIRGETVDLVFSQAVLEHIRRNEFLETQKGLARILKADGICSHRVDLRDHLGGGLNNLRFSERVWESEFFARSGFYTNRIGFHPMINAFQEAGFEAEVCELRRWKILPIERRHLASEFRILPDDALNVSGFDVLLRLKIGSRV